MRVPLTLFWAAFLVQKVRAGTRLPSQSEFVCMYAALGHVVDENNVFLLVFSLIFGMISLHAMTVLACGDHR